MAATVQFYQTTGAAPGLDTAQGTGSGSNDWDFKSLDAPGPIQPGEEITAGDFSTHAYIKARFGGTFTSITSVKYYASDLNLSGCGTGAYIIGSGILAANYSQPSSVSKSGTWNPIPTISNSGIDISTAALAAGTPGFTNYVGLQLKTNVSGALPGRSSFTSFTLTYTEI